MSVSISWLGGAHSETSIPSGSYIGFYGSAFNASIPLNNYNDTTVVTNKLGTINSGALPNFKYTTPGFGIWTNPVKGTSSGSISTASFGDMTLHIEISSGSAVRLSSVNLIAYEGIDISTGPTDATVVGFEQGTSDWTVMDGSGAPLALTPHTSSGSLTHDYYIAIAASPIVKNATTNISFALQANWY